jgi:catechol 2,3-dioxygenase-like lactoylglutathione lyase family enzyme
MTFHDQASAITHMFVVADMSRSRDWYVSVLGAEVSSEYGGTSCVLDWKGTWLLLVTGGEPTADKPDVTLEAPATPQRTARSTIFRVADCQAAYVELEAKGAHFLTPPVSSAHETRAFFTDPDGHLFEISALT